MTDSTRCVAVGSSLMSSNTKDSEELTATPTGQTTSSPKAGERAKTPVREKSSQRHGSLEAGGRFPQTLLNVGFAFALLLSGACLILSAIYLYRFLFETNIGVEQLIAKVGTNLPPGTLEVAINGRLVMARVALLSCGIFAGLAFGFLGFALFLLGIKKEIDVDAQYESVQIKFARMSPGVLVILIAAVLIGVCATRATPFWYENAVVETPEESADSPQGINQSSNANLNQNSSGNQNQSKNLPRRTKDLTP